MRLFYHRFELAAFLWFLHDALKEENFFLGIIFVLFHFFHALKDEAHYLNNRPLCRTEI